MKKIKCLSCIRFYNPNVYIDCPFCESTNNHDDHEEDRSVFNGSYMPDADELMRTERDLEADDPNQI